MRMAEKRNLTIQLDAEIIRKARVLAVERSMSLSGLAARELERLVSDQDRYRSACQQAPADLETGFHLGGGLLSVRDDLHERRGQNLCRYEYPGLRLRCRCPAEA